MQMQVQSLSTWVSLEPYQILFKNRAREGNFYSDCFRDIAVKKSYTFGKISR